MDCRHGWSGAAATRRDAEPVEKDPSSGFAPKGRRKLAGNPRISDAAHGSRLTGITYPDNSSISYTYGSGGSLNDVIGRLDAMKQGAVTLSSFTYLGLSTVVEEDEPTMKLTYIMQDIGVGLYGDAGDECIGLDRFGRVIDQKWLDSSGGTLDDYQYAYDRDSNVVAKTNGVLGSFSETYTYSGLSQLTAVARGTNSQAFGVTSIGDITSITTNGATLNHTVNSANQITTISGGGGGASLTYDANGNLLTDDQGEVLTYNGWNELVSVASTTGTMIATYSYDGTGDLISETEGGTATDLYYSGSQDIDDRASASPAPAAARRLPTQSTAWIIKMMCWPEILGGTRVYFTHDANYDITGVVGTSGTMLQRMAYDAYGKVTFLTNGGSVTTDGYNLTHLWQGGLKDAATGMYHFGARWYSVSLQQWVSVDPARAGMNWYEAVADNPINMIDPTGMDGMPGGGTGMGNSQNMKVLIDLWSETGQIAPKAVQAVTSIGNTAAVAVPTATAVVIVSSMSGDTPTPPPHPPTLDYESPGPPPPQDDIWRWLTPIIAVGGMAALVAVHYVATWLHSVLWPPKAPAAAPPKPAPVGPGSAPAAHGTAPAAPVGPSTGPVNAPAGYGASNGGDSTSCSKGKFIIIRNNGDILDYTNAPEIITITSNGVTHVQNAGH